MFIAAEGCCKVTTSSNICFISSTWSVFFPLRVYLYRGHNPPSVDRDPVHRPANGGFWPKSLQRFRCAVLRWRYCVFLSISCSSVLPDHLSNSGFLFRRDVCGPVGAGQTLSDAVQGGLHLSSCAPQNRKHHVWLPGGGTQRFSLLHMVSLTMTWFVKIVKTVFFLIPINQIPLPLDMIGSDHHPVKVGLSDAFLLNQTIYEYHRFEINATEVTSFSAVEFTALPSQWSPFFPMPRLKCWLQDTNTSPCVSVQPACNITAVNSACHPAKPLTAAGATFSRGETDFRAVPTPTHSHHRLYIHIVCIRCSDGMDRHRQEWLDNACSLEVLREISCFSLFPRSSNWHVCICIFKCRARMQPVGYPPRSKAPQVQPRYRKWPHWPLSKEAVTVRMSNFMSVESRCDCVKVFCQRLRTLSSGHHDINLFSLPTGVTKLQTFKTGNVDCCTYSLWKSILKDYTIYNVIILCKDVTTDPSTKSELWMRTGVIVGIAAALVLLLAVIVVALYLNCHHPNPASPLYAIQVSSLHVLNLTCVTVQVWSKSGTILMS